MARTDAPCVAIVKTGSANLASVVAAVDRAGFRPDLTSDPSEVRESDRLILPGVGAFGAAMRELHASRLTEPLHDRISADRPTLGICLGLQLLCRSSQESPGVEGLGIIDAMIERFPTDSPERIPQMGWNRVQPQSGFELAPEAGFAYFANSYRLVDAPVGWSVCTTEYCGRFVSALCRSNTLACQFHPELSGTWGASLLSRWLALPLGRTTTAETR